MLESGLVMAGNPQDSAKVLDAFQASGVDQAIIHMQMGNVPHEVPHERIMEFIQLIGTVLIPRYR